VAGTPKVAQPMLEQTGALAFEGAGCIGLAVGAHRPIQVVAEDERHAPLVDPLLRFIAGIAHRRIGVDLAHEAGPAVGPDQLGAGQLERQQRGLEGG
jgi:hypothetical protein